MNSEHAPIALPERSGPEIVRALELDGFQVTERQGSHRVYRHLDKRRVVIHSHRPSDTLPPYVIRNLLIGTRWTEDDVRRLGLVK